MKILDLYNDHNIPHITAGQQHRHSTDGWVNTHCPFCPGSQDYHLGYNLEGDYFHCWRCGGKFPDQVISKLLQISRDQAGELIKKYGGRTRRKTFDKKIKVSLKSYRLPSGDLFLREAHQRYLHDRGFDTGRLMTEWQVTGTGPTSSLDGINYSKRILSPIHWNGKEVSFQCRTIIPDKEPKYMACPMEREIMHHQHILYGKQEKWKSRGVCVEGVTDVWRMGVNSFGVFGIDYTRKQVLEIKNHFQEVVILFDSEPQAQRQARRLQKQLEAYGLRVWIETLEEGDPGGLSQEEADYIMKQIMSKR